MDDGRLVVVSPFSDSIRRNTKKLADKRNEFAADLAEKVLILYAAPGSQLLNLARRLIAAGKPVLTIDCKENEALLEAGAKPYPSCFIG